MIARYFERRATEIKLWWKAPIRAKDRILGAVVGTLGGFWIGVIAWLMFGVVPAPLAAVIPWVIVAMAIAIILGIVFPKPVTVLLFPFSMFGIGS